MRIQSLLNDHSRDISSVHVTLDSHQRLHIAHGLFWQGADGNPPSPFTLISAEDVAGGKWKAVNSEDQAAALRYVQALEVAGKFQLCIWPEHCIIGSAGHNVVAPVNEALGAWQATNRCSVDWVFKGQVLRISIGMTVFQYKTVLEMRPFQSKFAVGAATLRPFPLARSSQLGGAAVFML